MSEASALFKEFARLNREHTASYLASAKAINIAQGRVADLEKVIEQYAKLFQSTGQKQFQTQYKDTKAICVDVINEWHNAEIAQIENLLVNSLDTEPQFSAFRLPASLTKAKSKPQAREVPKPSRLQLLKPGAKNKYENAVKAAAQEYKKKYASYQQDEKHRQIQIRHLEQFRQKYGEHDVTAIVEYFSLMLDSCVYPETFPRKFKMVYVPESRQLVIEHDLPALAAMPQVKNYKYVKSRDEITSSDLPATQKKKLYSSAISQLTLCILHTVFKSDASDLVDALVFNGYVDSVDPATGQAIRPCLVTVRTTKDVFQALDLRRVEPDTCLKGLNASVSKKPEELAPVRPVVEFNMVDARFVEEADVLSGLDQRQNLMELSPFEFENLISNLFQKMGLETRQTQSSRDGGVDCVAYDPRPIFGGKVIIQAKRYKNTVGVSAVRDLFGTLQNEGASKGILVTTSGYGKAAFEFADGKPLELLDGSNLLYLLAEHADIEAKIEVPEDWQDPKPD